MPNKNSSFLNTVKSVAAAFFGVQSNKNRERDLFSQNKDEKAIYLEYFGDKNGNKVPDPEEIGIKEFEDDGDFRSEECISLLKEADIVVTNPPFSLWRPYVTQLLEYKLNHN